MTAIIDRAEREDRRLIMLTTASRSPNEAPEPSGLLRPAEARGLAESLAPVPWSTDRAAALEAVRSLGDVDLVGMDVVEVSPPYDVAEITALAAATLAHDFICLRAVRAGAPRTVYGRT